MSQQNDDSEIIAGWQKKLGMIPPVSFVGDNEEEALVSIKTVEHRMRQDGLKKYIVRRKRQATLKEKIVYYLYGSGFEWDDYDDDEYYWHQDEMEERVEQINLYLKRASSDGMKAVVDKLSLQEIPVSKSMELAKQAQSLFHKYQQNAARLKQQCAKPVLWRLSQQLVLRYHHTLEGASTIFAQDFPFVATLQNEPRSSCLPSLVTYLGYKRCLGREGSNDGKASSVSVDKLAEILSVKEYESVDMSKALPHLGEYLWTQLPCLGKYLWTEIDIEEGTCRETLERLKNHGPAVVSFHATEFLGKISQQYDREVLSDKNYPVVLSDDDVLSDENEAYWFDIAANDHDSFEYSNLGRKKNYGQFVIPQLDCVPRKGDPPHGLFGAICPSRRIKRLKEWKEPVVRVKALKLDTPAPNESQLIERYQNVNFIKRLESNEEIDIDRGGFGLPGEYTMVLIGSRQQKRSKGDIKHWFLLQSSLANIPLLEVSWECLERNANCFYVFEGSFDLPASLNVTSELCTSTSFNDGGEKQRHTIRRDDDYDYEEESLGISFDDI